jgi:hypothetical protein
MSNSVKVMTQPTLSELRSIQWEQIQAIRNGTATAQNVNAISNAMGKILQSIKLELEYHKLVGKTPNMPELLAGGEPQQPDLPNVAAFERKAQ